MEPSSFLLIRCIRSKLPDNQRAGGAVPDHDDDLGLEGLSPKLVELDFFLSSLDVALDGTDGDQSSGREFLFPRHLHVGEVGVDSGGDAHVADGSEQNS
jgi:hypothetical protein